MRSQQQYRHNESWGGGVTRRSRELDNSADRIDGFRDKLCRPCAGVPHDEEQAEGEQGQQQEKVQLEKQEQLEEQVQLQEQPPSHQATPDDPKHGGHAAKQQAVKGPQEQQGVEHADHRTSHQAAPSVEGWDLQEHTPSLQATPVDPRLGGHAGKQEQD